MIRASRFVASALLPSVLLAAPLGAQDSHLVVIEGLAGSPEHGEAFRGWSTSLVTAAVERHGVAADHVHYLAPDPATAEGAEGRSDAEGVRAVLADISLAAGADDVVTIVLIGHGTSTGDESKFNLPGPDLTADEWGDALVQFPTQRVVFVNTASSSGGFVDALSARNRTVITATRSARERNETIFPGYFVQAFAEEGADINRDGRISFFEAFEYARLEVARDYEEQDLLATEHAMLDDDGDGQGTSEPVQGEGDGILAARIYLQPVAASDASPEVRRLLAERGDIERAIDALRERKDAMSQEDYEAQLEALLVRLAEKNAEIRAAGGGG